MSKILSLLLVSTLLPSVSSASEPPRPVSPGGGGDAYVAVQTPCPTFSWAPVSGAEAHELVVYPIDDAGIAATEPAAHVETPGAAGAWTPALGHCLERGERYAWAVRARVGEDWTDWSQPSRFALVSPAAMALPEDLEAAIVEVIDRHVAGRGLVFRDAAAPNGASATASVLPAVTPRPRPQASSGVGAGFNVDATGAVSATSFTGDGSVRSEGAINNGSITVSSTSYVSLLSRSITAPNDGSLLIVATVEMFCTNFSSAGDTAASVTFDVDDLTGWAGIDYPLGIPDCLDDAAGTAPERFITVTHLTPVTAGAHTVHILGKKNGGTQHPTFSDRVLSVLFID